MKETLQLAREALAEFLCYELRKADMARGREALAAIDDALAKLNEPLPPQTEEEIDAECERILSMSEEQIDAELRAQGLNPAWEAERARIIAKCAIWHHQRSALNREEPATPPGDEVEVVLEDEQAAHQDTLRLLFARTELIAKFVACFDQKKHHGWDMPALWRVYTEALALDAHRAAQENVNNPIKTKNNP